MSRRNNGTSDISITGIGVLTAVGQGKEAFLDALMEGRHAFDVMKRLKPAERQFVYRRGA